jgi:histidyl-tRNA synthetase
MLDNLGIEYIIDPGIVRGLDYYTKTVFEFISKNEGYTVLAGGRYDGLIKELDGKETKAIGFAMGVERLVEVYEKYNKDNMVKDKTMSLYIANIGNEANIFASKLVQELRQAGIFVEKDISEKSLKAQLKYADKKNSKYTIIIGDDEIKQGEAKIKNMDSGEENKIKLTKEDIIKFINR